MNPHDFEQLELPLGRPFLVRLRVGDSLRLWWERDWSKTRKARNTAACLRRIIAHWGERYQETLVKADLEDLRARLASLGLKGNTVNTHHTMVSRWIHWLHECREAGEAHGVNWRLVALPRPDFGRLVRKENEERYRRNVAWPKAVVAKFVAAAQRLEDQEAADIIEFSYITKLRPMDVWEVTDRNVDLAHKVLSGIQHKSISRRMPSGLPYILPITPRLEAILRRRIKLRNAGETLFREPGVDAELWRAAFYRRFVVLRRYAQLPHVNLCDFRPAAATLELDNGVDPLTVSNGLGHTSLRMLPVYARRSLLHQRRAQEIVEDATSEILS